MYKGFVLSWGRFGCHSFIRHSHFYMDFYGEHSRPIYVSSAECLPLLTRMRMGGSSTGLPCSLTSLKSLPTWRFWIGSEGLPHLKPLIGVWLVLTYYQKGGWWLILPKGDPSVWKRHIKKRSRKLLIMQEMISFAEGIPSSRRLDCKRCCRSWKSSIKPVQPTERHSELIYELIKYYHKTTSKDIFSTDWTPKRSHSWLLKHLGHRQSCPKKWWRPKRLRCNTHEILRGQPLPVVWPLGGYFGPAKMRCSLINCITFWTFCRVLAKLGRKPMNRQSEATFRTFTRLCMAPAWRLRSDTGQPLVCPLIYSVEVKIALMSMFAFSSPMASFLPVKKNRKDHWWSVWHSGIIYLTLASLGSRTVEAVSISASLVTEPASMRLLDDFGSWNFRTLGALRHHFLDAAEEIQVKCLRSRAFRRFGTLYIPETRSSCRFCERLEHWSSLPFIRSTTGFHRQRLGASHGEERRGRRLESTEVWRRAVLACAAVEFWGPAASYCQKGKKWRIIGSCSCYMFFSPRRDWDCCLVHICFDQVFGRVDSWPFGWSREARWQGQNMSSCGKAVRTASVPRSLDL